MMKWLIPLLLCFITSTIHAHEEHTRHSSGAPGAALALNFAADAQGRLWRAGVKDGFVEVSASSDRGKTFSRAVRVNRMPQKIGAEGEARPKIAVSSEGFVYVTWTESLKKPFAGYIWFARSLDAGHTFESPYIVHTDRSEITHRFDALHVSAKGRITVAWIDKRDLLAAKASQRAYEGAAIYYAVSEDKGASFMPERKLADSSCECCRIALASKPDGTVVAMWRHVFAGNERDHMIAEIPVTYIVATPTRATFGRWKIDGCPHHGAALATGGTGDRWWGYHMAWFDGGNEDSGKNATLYYARMDGEAWVSSPAKKFGNMKKQAGHPALLAHGDVVWLVWREKDAGKNLVWLMQSSDEGKSWSDPTMVAETNSAADYPILLQHDKGVLLLWNTLEQGLKIVPLQ